MKSPKEKAEELIKMFENFTTIWIEEGNCYKSPKKAKQGALIVVDEVINANDKIINGFTIKASEIDEIKNKFIFWEEVKTEIHNFKWE